MRSRANFALAVAVLAALPQVGCRRGRVLAGPPVAANGVRIQLRETSVRKDRVDVAILVFNDLDQEIVVNRNQIAVVGPDGVDYFRTGGRAELDIKAHRKRAVGFAVETGGVPVFDQAPGYYLRFDGLWAGSVRIDVPPMPVGQPPAGPGNTTAFNPPSSGGKRGVIDRVLEPVRGQPEDTGPKSVQTYNGPRRQLKEQGTKCAAIPLKATEVPSEVAYIMDEILLTEMQQVGFEAIGPEDINAMLGFEKVKDAVGCDDASCIAELGNALGVDFLVAGSVAKLEASMVLTLKIIDVRQTKVLARVNRIGDGGQGALPRLIAEAVQELVSRSEL